MFQRWIKVNNEFRCATHRDHRNKSPVAKVSVQASMVFTCKLRNLFKAAANSKGRNWAKSPALLLKLPMPSVCNFWSINVNRSAIAIGWWVGFWLNCCWMFNNAKPIALVWLASTSCYTAARSMSASPKLNCAKERALILTAFLPRRGSRHSTKGTRWQIEPNRSPPCHCRWLGYCLAIAFA